MSNIYDVARESGVSPSTVSRVINNSPNVSRATQDRVTAAMKRLNYRPSNIARGLALRKTQVLGLVVSNLRHRWSASIVEGLEAVASEHGYNVMVCNAADDSRKERMLLQSLLHQHTDGVMLMPNPDGRLTAQMSDLVYGSGIPCVVIWAVSEAIGTDTVTIDFRQGRYLLSKHLMDIGHRDICIVTGSPAYLTSQLHVDGHRSALEEAGLALNPSLIIHAAAQTSALQIGHELAETIARLWPRPTAVHAVNDLAAISMIGRFAELGIRVPEDMSVAGFDDIDLAEHFVVPLTTVRIPAKEMALEAGRLLISRIRGEATKEPRHIVLSPDLVLRQSTAPPGMA